MLTPQDFFDLDGFEHAALFDGCEHVWEALGNRLKHYVSEAIEPDIHGLVMEGAIIEQGAVFIAEGAVVEPGAFIKGPTIIGPDAEIRHGAYIRGHVIVGAGAIVGHASEVKGSVLLPGAKAPHFNYVGDALLGRKCNLGAGTKLSNLKVINERVKIPIDGELVDTGLRKFGGILGDNVQTGCNSVLNPGVLLGKDTLVYPNASVRKGYYPPRSIIKLQQSLKVRELSRLE